MSLHLPSRSTHTHTHTLTLTTFAPYSPSRGTTLVTVDINTLLCHWVRSAQEWKYLTGTIYRPCRRTGGIHSYTIRPILESCSTEIALAERSSKTPGAGSTTWPWQGASFFIERQCQLWVGECCYGVYRWKKPTRLLKNNHMWCNIHAGVHFCSSLCHSPEPFETNLVRFLKFFFFFTFHVLR